MILHLPVFFSSKQHVSPATTSLKINENKNWYKLSREWLASSDYFDSRGKCLATDFEEVIISRQFLYQAQKFWQKNIHGYI